MLINLAEETPPGIETWGLKSTPKILKDILLLKCSAKSTKKHTKRKLSLTQTQRHAKIRVQPLFSGVKSFWKFLVNECASTIFLKIPT